MRVGQKSFFDEENRMEKIVKVGDLLEMLNKVIKWEMFRSMPSSSSLTYGFSVQHPLDILQ